MRKWLKNCVLRGVALAGAVKRSQIIRPTSFVLFKNWNFGISTGYT